MEQHPQRKHPRLKTYDYSQNGAYFVTICVKNRANLLGSIPPGQNSAYWDDELSCQNQVILSDTGKVCFQLLQTLSHAYDFVTVDECIVMPNHIHMLMHLHAPDNTDPSARPSVSTIVRSFKTLVTKQIGHSVWQSSFHEHIVRNENDWLEIRKYIRQNPLKWELDSLYI